MSVTTKKAKRAAKPPVTTVTVPHKPKPEKIKLDKQVVTDLASCVLWALKYLKTPSGGGMWTDMSVKPMVLMPWQEKFMLALDGVGYQIDRKDFWKKQDAKKRKR